MAKKYEVADFETTGEEFYNNNGYTKVWLYAICDSESNMINIGYSIEEFMQYCKDNLCGTIVYFHNLKFDGNFIISYLLNNGFEYKEELKVKDKKGFTTLIGDMGQFYSIKVNFKGNKQITFYDSLKLLPFKVEKIAEDFGIEEKKLKINYNDYTINQQKIDYISHDAIIIAKALKIVKGEGLIKMTTASSAYHYFKGLIMGNEDILFPELNDEFLDSYRNAYRGGRSMVNPLYKNRKVYNVKRYDINSMYPYIMAHKPLPYGAPIPLKTPGMYNFELYKVRIMFNLKENNLPCLLKKGAIFGEDTYYINTEGIEELYISNLDLDLVKRHYDIIYLEYLEIWGFHTSTEIFKEYVYHFYELKNKSKGAQKTAYKLMLNSLYGKFGSNHKGIHKIPKLENEIVTYENSEEQEMKKYYLPMAIAITSWAHVIIDNGIEMTGVHNFVYCDTDSIHTLGNLPNEVIDNKELGKYKLEAVEEVGKYVRQKCYVYQEDGIINITCAGMTDELKTKAINTYKGDIFNIFKTGFTISGKLLPKVVKGGVILHETTFAIR